MLKYEKKKSRNGKGRLILEGVSIWSHLQIDVRKSEFFLGWNPRLLPRLSQLTFYLSALEF